MAYLIRVHIPDRPGSLGALAVTLGSIGADIESLEVIERGSGYAIDDLVVNLSPGSLPDAIITAAEKLNGVVVDSIRPYSGTLDLHRELELIENIAADKTCGWATLTREAPAFLRVSWLAVIGKDPVSGKTIRLAASPSAPETLPEAISPWPQTRAISYDHDEPWIPQVWHDCDTALAAAPLIKQGHIMLLGRLGGPEFREPEIARFGYLAGIISSIIPEK